MIEQLHAVSFSDPIVGGSAFAYAMRLDVTVKGHGRLQLDELCIYEVKDGKIISERFTSRLPV
jgi:limonene-1,2-epoxide hydrolase